MRTINLGSGASRLEGAVNVDIRGNCGADVVHDLRKFPWPFATDTFRQVRCFDILEHLPDAVATMEEIHRIGMPGAVVEITTPHFSSANAFKDPTHCHQFSLFSFDFFTGDMPAYTDVRFGYRRRALIFHQTRTDGIVRRVANRWPVFYERHLCWIWPAWFIVVELTVIK